MVSGSEGKASFLPITLQTKASNFFAIFKWPLNLNVTWHWSENCSSKSSSEIHLALIKGHAAKLLLLLQKVKNYF